MDLLTTKIDWSKIEDIKFSYTFDESKGEVYFVFKVLTQEGRTKAVQRTVSESSSVMETMTILSGTLSKAIEELRLSK